MTAAAELTAIIDGLDRFPRDAVELVNGALVDAITAQARLDTGGDFVLSGAAKTKRGQKRTKLKLTSRVQGSTAVIGTVSAAPRHVRAQWAWLDTGTKRRGNHPGTPAKRTFTGPANRVLPLIERRVADRFELAVVR